MASANFNVRIDQELKATTNEVLKGYGLTLTQAVKLFFNEISQTKQVPLSFDYQAETPNQVTLQAMEDFLKEHETLDSMSVKDALADMKQMAERAE